MTRPSLGSNRRARLSAKREIVIEHVRVWRDEYRLMRAGFRHNEASAREDLASVLDELEDTERTQ